MKTGFRGLAKTGALLALLALGLAWSAPVLADEAATITTVAASAPERPVRLPALKLGEIRSGYVMMISERGVEGMKPAAFAQQMIKPSTYNGFCIPR